VSVDSLFTTHPNAVLDVYGGQLENLRLGLETMISQMMGSSRNLHITQYALGMVVLARKLQKDPPRLDRISEVIETAKRQQEHFGEMSEQVIETLARAYQENISSMSPRIMVRGMPEFLQNPANAARIRVLLLAGIRSAILWYQTGGNRWQLVWKRRVYLKTAQQLLKRLPQKPIFSPE
jgi:high frequency lysogenization protein